MKCQRWYGNWKTIRVIFLAPLSLTILIMGARLANGAGQFPPSQGHAMGSAPCVWADPITGADKALDVTATIRTLQDNGFGCVAQVVWNQPPNTFAEFKRLLAAAQPAGISVWPVLIPPSEGGNSLPYQTDYVGWMKELARLSLQYPVLRGVNVDDYLSGISTKTFTRPYTCSLYQAKQEINPKLLFVPTIYDLDQGVADQLAGCIDGVWFWWVNLESNAGLRTLLEDSRLVVANRFPIYAGVYSHWTSWHKEHNPSPKVLQGALEIGCRYADGAIIWNLPLAPNSPDNLLLGVARFFAPGGSADLAGKCGLSTTSPATKPGGKGP